MDHVTRLWRRLAARRGWSVVLVGALSLAVSGFLSSVRPPLPHVHDEFSYLLAADTFARGRLSQPPHPCWEHFESFHVLHHPRYASKYPPAQGLLLALGQRLTGRPIAGVWLGLALGSAAVCWMLQAWTRPRWALLGGVITALHLHGGISRGDPANALYSWSQSYWGGGAAMLGGALFFGAVARLVRRPCASTSVLLGVGLGLLANSRPFEGLLVVVPALFAMVALWLRRRAFSPRTLLMRVGLPFALVVIPCGVGMGVYNRAVTGSALRLPYSVYEAAYNPAPIFNAWQRPAPTPVYRHDVIHRFFTGWALDQWRCQQTAVGWWRYHCERWIGWMGPFFVGPLVIPFLAIPMVLGRPRNAFAAAECLLVIAAHTTTVGIIPHYAAPVFGCFMLLIVESLRQLAVLRIGPVPIGRALVGLTLALVVFRLGTVAQARAAAPPGWETERSQIEAALAAAGERHLIVVRYGPAHNVLDEWVYNGADIDGARIVWAREMDPARMRRLLSHFHDRRIWLLEADQRPVRLSPYPAPPAQRSARHPPPFAAREKPT
jgi:hypothetical protein